MKRTALFIGGTGTISMAITRLLATKEWDVELLNRGNRSSEIPEGIKVIKADINDEEAVLAAIGDKVYDCVCEFIGFVPEQIERDIRLFEGRCRQYIYISSASAYHKPVMNYMINEGTALANPYWEYSRNKIACEDVLMAAYRERQFPVTIIRPSHTYDERALPMGVHGEKGSYQVVKRMLEGKPVIVHGDGTSLWTMTFNEDFAKAYVGIMGNPHAIGEAFQITNDESLTWNQIFKTIADALGVEYKPYYVSSQFLSDCAYYDLGSGLLGDKACTVVFDNQKIKSVVPDFAPSIRFEEGVRIVLDNIMKHPELQIEDPEFDAWCDKLIEKLERVKAEMQ